MTEPTVGSEAGAATVAGLLRARAAERPDQVAFTFLADGEQEGGRLTYGELDRRAAAIAAALAAAVRAGDRALLLYPPGLDFIAAFFGCLYAGVVAVPAYPPRPNDRSQSRLRAIAHDATPRAALTTEALLAGAVEPRGLLAVAPELAGLRWIPTDALGGGTAAAAPDLPEPDPESVAFLQYTSGSTAAPKGVMVTHANLLHNERMIGAAFGMDEDSVVVGWLPLYHDMGLIGNVLQPLHAGGRCVLMSPVAFLQRPMRWLEAIDRYRGTTSGGPNFAYELCVRKASPEALEGLDLSSWKLAFNGAEPVRASTLERFAATFAPTGFRAAAFYPCYGLAEATLFVTGGHGSAVEKERVSCGRVWMGQRLVAVDPETGVERPAGEEGEIWVAGPSVARGYWENEEATALDFNAFLPSGEGPFLRTGDLGFLSGGELYVTGRLKDLVILRGRNLYPQDVELTAERSHPDLQPGGGAAFSVESGGDGGDGGEERLVIVHEVARHRRGEIGEIAEAVRRAVAAEHEAQVHEVVLIRQAGLPKTSSGKVQRRRCRELYLAGELPVVGRSALAGAGPAPEIAAALTPETLAALEPAERRAMLAAYLGERAAAALGLPAAAVALDQPLTGLGLDSLSAIELKGAVESALGLSLPLADLLQGASALDLAERALAGSAEEALPPLRALSTAGDGPLSAGQRGLWFLHRLAPAGGAYNIAVAARVRGLDAAAFAGALNALAARHEALRTVFPTVGDEPVQRVLPELAPDVRSEAAGEDLERRLAAEAWRPFSLEEGPLLRARIFETPDSDESVLLLVVHHIVADFASLAVMARDLSALYRGETREPPALRYADFVRWQAEALAGARGERLWSYWRRQLAGLSDLDLAADHPRPPVQTWRGGARAASLSPDLAAALGALAAGRRATPFMALLAAFQAQLARYTGQEDFAVGSPVAGRPLPELAGVVGYFVNLLPLRADLAGEPGFGALLDRARATALAGIGHGDFPFPLAAERLRPVRDPARPPLFQAMLVFQQGRPGDEPGLATFSLGEAGARLDLGGLALESVRLAERRAQVDLALFAAGDGRGGLGLALEFNSDLFDGGTVERMLGHLRTLLEGAVAAPEVPFWHLPLLSEAERGQFFETWDDTACDYPRGGLLHQLFEARAARTPEAEAVVAGEVRLTYGELNARANRLAHRLRRLGIGPEDRVGICLRRSERMIVSLLAILKAGGAYVPLDPTYPRERLKAILDDSAARVVIGEAATAPRLAAESGDRWLAVDSDLAGESAGNPAPMAISSNLAYLIYTSGSTGKPKAVAIEHRSPVVLMHWSRELFPPEELAGALAATSIGFDVSVFEIFAPLSWGGRIFVVENLLALPVMTAASEVRLVCGAPSVVAELVRAGRFPPWVRTVNLGGEAVPPALVEGLAAAAPGARIVNAYGPSEDTTYTAIAFLEAGRPVAIGRPVAGSRIYLLDRHGEPVPAGVPGELYIAGEGLSRGYLDRPELTAEKLVPDPFSTAPGARLYRVGDLARRRPDGVLDYLGRIDHQVKIRGFRVELGEIEAALARHPGVSEAVVVAREDGDRGQRLVAYVAPRGAPAAELRSCLREILPEYMVPAAFVHLDAFPLSANGKVDRRALPEPAAAGVAAAAFRTPVEEMLAGVVAEVLGVERVGVQDDFFALGGHSLLATRLLARVSRLFGVDLPVSDVFLHPTVAALAERIAAESGGAALPPIQPLPRRPDQGVPLSFAQRRLWFLDRLEPGSAVYHLPGAVRLSGPLDLAAVAAALAEIARRHEALRTVFRRGEGEPVQVVLAAGASLPRIDLAALPADAAAAEAERLAGAAAVAPFDLERGPLWRALAVRLAPEEHVLVLTLHHIVADGWSLGILVSELAVLYEAFAAGRPSPLSALPVQYADWAVWQRDRLRGGVLEEETAWWRERLAGVPVLELPADRPRAAGAARGGTRATLLPAAPAAALERLARREGATPFMLLLAAFQAQLARYTGAPSVPVGSPVANRGRTEVEGVIGLFVNLLVLRTPVEGDPTFQELLARTREVCLGAYAHQDIPFERLVEALQPERTGARTPLFQAVFQLAEPLAVERLGAAAATIRPLETGTAKFDLGLSLLRGPDGFAATLEYDAGRFDPATADRLLGHWRTLTAGIAAEPLARLSDLPLLDPAEAAQIRAWNGFVTEYPRQATIHELFAAEARRAPDAVAVETGDARLTYGELEARANRLARHLRRLGVGPEVPVGLCLERSAELIVAMLGALKAGGAYVPLDPGYPEERLAFLAADTGFSVAVLREGSRPALPPGLTLVPLAAGGELAGEGLAAAESSEPLPELAGPAGLACILYTSGSTGRPKGVQIVHRGVVRLVRGTSYAPFAPGEVFLHVAPASFDATLVEVFGALLNGARLAVLPAGTPSLAELAAAIARHGVTVLWLTAGLFHQMVERRLDGLRGVKCLIAGGDVISPDLMRRAVAGLPGCLLEDAYGPTENTTFSALQPLPAVADVASPVPIGRPIANSTVHLLDAAFRPVPAGVPGELYTGGDGLSRGYRGRPELTAERFVPSPFPASGFGGERLYRTGDVARWRPDGSLEFLGRRDQQVKIRGFRVEPGEIEAVLARHPGVADVAVVVRDEAGGKALAAYIVPRGGEELPADLSEHVRASLPKYMRPAYLIALPALPLNANDKVDRRALAALEVRPAAGAPTHEAPGSPVEERLAAIWREVLGIEQVGIHDDFFALGGHSLLAIAALARIGEAFGVDLAVSDLFAAPTVAGLAERLAAGPREPEETPVGRELPPAPAARRTALSELPRTPLEEQVAAVWREVLGIEQIGVHDDFFDLGGHSLLAHRVVMRIADQLDVDLDLQALFETPTVAGLAGRIAEGGMARAGERDLPVLPAAAGDSFPLSFAQQRLWLLDRIGRGDASYNLPAALRLEGDLEAAPLARALAWIVRRHEPLRTVYAVVKEEPVQVVLPPPGESGLPLARLDLCGLTGPARERALRDALRAEGNRPFDLTRGPVARFLLVRLGDREHVLLATLHHIATDGWSMSVFFRELVTFYGDFAAGREPSLPAPPLRYADWAARQRREMVGGKLDAQIAYWRRQLAGLPVLELPTDRPRSAGAGDRGGNRRVELPAELARSLHGRLGAGGGITSFNLLLTGFAALLARLSGQDDFAIGLPAAGRNRPHAEGLIGFFVNTLVTRVQVADDPPVPALLRRLRDTALAAQNHQDVPFERLVEELQPERAAGVSPLFQVVLNYLASPLARVPMPGLEVSLVDVELGVAKFDLTLSAYEEGGSLHGWVEYRAALFDPATVERWMGHLRTLLAGAAADPSRRLSELPLLAAAERWQMIAEWNATDLPLAGELCLHELVERQAARTPEAPAVLAEDGELSYGELDARAERLARRLRRRGVGPEVAVGLFAERSAAMVVAILGVLKAGGAYLPLDPAYPAERLAGMLADAAAPVLLVPEALRDKLPPHRAQVVLLDSEEEDGEAGGPPAPPRATAGNLACVIFTSGSTGRPKGVMLPHRGLVNRLLWAQETYRLTAADAVLLKAASGFDFAIWECFAPLLAGAQLVVARPGGHQDAGYLARTIAGRGVTIVHFVPSMLDVFLGEEGAGACRSLRQVFAGGEALSPALRERFLARFPGVPLDNQYGPTEISIDTTRWVCAPGQDPRRVPLGRPIGNTRLHLLDRGRWPVPVGVPGVLHVGGEGVARGYLGRPDLTAERFVPDPAGEEERLYDTGDLARRLPDGNLEFLGRADSQVKVRGVRVEPGEIEAALRRHPAVAAAAVGADAEGARLIAWVVPRPDGAPADGAPAALHDFLRGWLPEAMIPSLFVPLDALPLTPSGKLDRRALPPPAAPAAGGAGEDAPATPAEQLLAGLWSDLLGVGSVGAHDDFFTLGGHSLLATQAVSRVREAFDVELTPADLFLAPTPTGLAARIVQLRGEGMAAAPPPRPAPRDPAGEPLSFSQERLWFLQQLEPESSAYNVPGALRLRGPLRPGLLARALGEIVRRHEALRTVFRESAGGVPVQIVRPPSAVPLPVVDLRAVPSPAAERLLTAEARRPFDLAAGPLVRALLLRAGDEEHLLAVVMHHAVSDAWSLRILLRELAALYQAFAAGEPSPLPELPLQYADFARWQREQLAGERLEAELAHWRQALAGAPETLDLPADRPRPAAPTNASGRHPVALPPALAADLRALARRQGWTPFMALLTAFDALLSRLTGQRDLVVGAPIANRNRLETEGVIGFFTNTLALRLDLAGDPSFRALARRARRATLAAYAHQDLPFERLVEDLAPRRERGRNPIFQVMLALNDVPSPAPLELPGVGVEGVEIAAGEAKFDLTLFLAESADGFAGHLEFSRDLFDPATAERLLGHLLTLLAGAVAEPQSRLSELPLLSPAEREQLAAWSRPPLPRPPGERAWCVHERVAEQAARNPQAEAVVIGDGGESLTYGELLRRARRVAVHLRGLGVGPDVPVGIFLDRSPDLAIAILGVLEAGGAYLPLDPGYPRERLRLMLEDARVPVVLTSPALAGALPEGTHRTLRIEEALAGPEPALPLAPAAVDPDNLVYLIYTSGSTGRPKGVAMTHGAISAMLDWQLRTSRAGAGRTLQFAALSFDVSFQEIFSTWCAGGAVVLVDDDVRRDPPALLRLLKGQRVERLFLPFVALQQLALAARPGEVPGHLREVMSAGEQLYVTPQVASLFAALPGAALYNHYGPSETHAATWLPLTGEPAGWPERPTVGRAVDHARVFLLDADLRPVPVGVPGELYVGGAGLARGYLAQPELTAERFLPDPFDGVDGWEPGSRLYRTGDLARRRYDGEIEYIGRGDHQVKIRGQRVELAEVETALARHPALRQAAAAVRGAGAGVRRLVAYVVFRDGVAPPATAELRAFLAESLPDAMVPSVWVRLESLPLTPSGKIDRRSLPVPEVEEEGEDGLSRAPRDPAEEMLAGIWSEVLGVRRVGIHDDFFELGGHSLLATQVMSRVREAFDVEIPLRRLFEGPTVAELAHAVEAALAAGAPAPDGPIPRAPRALQGAALPLSFAQERLWFLDRLQPGETVYSLPLVLRLAGELDVAALAAAFGEIVRRHEVLRTVFVERAGSPAQVVAPAPRRELAVADLAGLPAVAREREVARLARDEAARPFDLARGPLVRTTLLRLAGRRHELLLNLHHIVSDGWSAGVLVREVGALYAAAREGRPSPLPELPIQYADFALWQRGWLAGEALARQTGYWRERLHGLPAEIELPADRPRPAVPSHRGAEHRFALDARSDAALAALARREGTTPFMVLAASMLALLSRLSGRGDLAIGTPIANRNRAETEGLIGFFVNTLVLRADVAEAPGFHDLLRQVRETTLGAYAHQDMPFEKVIDELQPERDPARTPFFQVMFALQNTPRPAADLPGLALAAEEPPSRSAKFDLTLALSHAGGGLAAAIEYATDLFDPPTIVRFAGQWCALLAAAVERPDAALAALPLLAAGQRHQILQEWNDSARAWEDDPALHQLFERQAGLRPAAPAGICQGETVTYGELEARANRLAHHLRRLGVRRAEPVGLWMERSLDLLAAVLGILKAGGLYVPLDAAWPAERVEAILAGTAAPVLVAGPALLPAVAGLRERLPGLRHIVAPGDAADEPAARPAPVTDADDPAYLIHTSGSTGAPKGIVVRHRSAANTLRWNNETLEMGPSDRHLFVNSICFDLSIYDLLGMLGAGAAVRVATEEEVRDPERLAAILREEGITTWNSAPAALLQLVPFFPPAGEGGHLRRVLLAGDWIPLSLPDRVRESFPAAQIANFGGATETSVWSNWYPIGAVDPSWAAIPYGRPIANTRYYILDAGLAPCPPGVPGDNYIGGDCPALGYAALPALTAERFLPDPFSPLPGARMYATGDRARCGADGTLEFLGRVDFQVKVRGYRIELGEIEAALLRHPQVREAVALARGDVAGEKRLVAYVVPAGAPAPPPTPGELREALQRTLPEYMVPWSFVMLDRLPVTANGKLDRQALPSPQAAGTAGEAAYVAPRNDLERTIAEVWREVLELDRVGVHDNFFESGGSSLLIVKLHGRLNAALGAEIPILELFRHTTIDALARQLAAGQEGAAPAAAAAAKAEQGRERVRSRQDSLRQLRQSREGRRGKP